MNVLDVAKSVKDLKELEESIDEDLIPNDDASLVVHDMEEIPDHIGINSTKNDSAVKNPSFIPHSVPNRALNRINV